MLSVKAIFADGIARPLTPVAIPDGQAVLITVLEPEVSLPEEDDPLAVEEAAFVALHPTLRTAYLGQYVAIHKEQLVDHDVDLAALTARVYAMLGDTTAVWIAPVQPTPYEEWVIRSPRWSNE
jgi:hypothetical protein